MSQTFKEHLVSAGVTFITAFVSIIALSLQSPDFQYSKSSIVALGISAIVVGIRALAKLVLSWTTGYTPTV